MTAKIISKAHHRNGVAGAPFTVALVTGGPGEPGRTYLVVMFDEPGYTAVLDVDMAASGNVVFGENSWRGDHFEAHLRPLMDS